MYVYLASCVLQIQQGFAAAFQKLAKFVLFGRWLFFPLWTGCLVQHLVEHPVDRVTSCKLGARLYALFLDLTMQIRWRPKVLVHRNKSKIAIMYVRRCNNYLSWQQKLIAHISVVMETWIIVLSIHTKFTWSLSIVVDDIVTVYDKEFFTSKL